METAKQCVTTDPPNSVALKMEEARRGRLTQQRKSKRHQDNDTLFLVNGREDEDEGFGVIRTEFFFSADLGSSSNYTSRKIYWRISIAITLWIEVGKGSG